MEKENPQEKRHVTVDITQEVFVYAKGVILAGTGLIVAGIGAARGEKEMIGLGVGLTGYGMLLTSIASQFKRRIYWDEEPILHDENQAEGQPQEPPKTE